MSAAELENVREARELRDLSEIEFRRAIVRADRAGHTLLEIGQAAGLTKTGVKYLLDREASK